MGYWVEDVKVCLGLYIHGLGSCLGRQIRRWFLGEGDWNFRISDLVKNADGTDI